MYVYLIKSLTHPERKYVGLTEDLERRLSEHNEGKSASTYRLRPWRHVVSVWFDDSDKARQFEVYLKSGSGRSFSLRHFW